MKNDFLVRHKKDWQRNKTLYLMVLPVLLFYICFHYKPMYGALMAFFDYRPAKKLFECDFVGLENFIRFFESPYFGRVVRNTLAISIGSLIIGFPAPIILALMLNEVRNMKFKRITQTLTYLPHFISTIVVCGMIIQFSLSDGLFNNIIAFFGGERQALLQNPSLYRPIYIFSGIWQGVGWGSILYLAALSGVDTQLYEAAMIDGAGKWRQVIHVTLPGIMPTIIIQLILNIGSLMSVGYEKTLNLYNESIYETADIISTYVYRMGIGGQDWSYSAAVGLFNSVINCILLVVANKMSKKLTETGLW
ncbi:MAG: sugar ABC transporter permease [Roseburia sp.]|nr:sugar ABC transporter permease [Roseburia sp.]